MNRFHRWVMLFQFHSIISTGFDRFYPILARYIANVALPEWILLDIENVGFVAYRSNASLA